MTTLTVGRLDTQLLSLRQVWQPRCVVWTTLASAILFVSTLYDWPWLARRLARGFRPMAFANGVLCSPTTFKGNDVRACVRDAQGPSADLVMLMLRLPSRDPPVKSAWFRAVEAHLRWRQPPPGSGKARILKVIKAALEQE